MKPIILSLWMPKQLDHLSQHVSNLFGHIVEKHGILRSLDGQTELIMVMENDFDSWEILSENYRENGMDDIAGMIEKINGKKSCYYTTQTVDLES